MLFNSFEFVVFFPVAVLGYYAVPHAARWAWLLACSYFFYMCWNPAYVVLILSSTIIDYVAALRMDRAQQDRTRRFWLIASLTGNLGLLFTFKYYNFFATSAEVFTEFYGLPVTLREVDLLLPVGISFYTFQSLSYTIDVYRKQRPADRHFGIFALYVSFFPQLVAGPIERSEHLLPQFYERHRWDMDNVRKGLLQMGAGFYKKCVIGDTLALYVDAVYGDPERYAGAPFMLAAYAFAIQVFVDFSGYSDIAIGAARVMGFDLYKNFDRPYHSKTVTEFWRRWHISLMSWFRDYIYIPLGGSQKGGFRHSFNIFLIFLISGVWHGAAWTFVIWGALCGIIVVFGVKTRPWRDAAAERFLGERFKLPRAVWQRLVVFHAFAVPLVLFRAQSIGDFYVFMTQSWNGVPFTSDLVFEPLSAGRLAVVLVAILLMEAVHVWQYRESVTSRILSLPLPVRWVIYAGLIFGILFFGTFQANDFVYFQF
jgi:alginate O-acetyltransferase complex protein AlgI